MPLPGEAPEAPVKDGQVEGQPEGQAEGVPQTPEEGQSGEQLFSEDETKDLSPQEKSRVDGMVKKYHQRMSEFDKQRRELSDLTAAIKEQSRQIDSARPEPVANAPVKTKLQSFMDKANPADKALITELVDGLREEFRNEVAPIAQRVAQESSNTERERTRQKYKDFDSVLTPSAVEYIKTNYPSINSYEAAYKTIKYQEQNSELERMKVELSKLQNAAKRNAGTEFPGGPSAESLSTPEYDNLPVEERRKLPMHKLVDMAQRKLRGRS